MSSKIKLVKSAIKKLRDYENRVVKNLDDISNEEILALWERYFKAREHSPYCGNRPRELSRIRTVRKAFGTKFILNCLVWLLVSGQDKFSRPGVGLLISDWLQEIISSALSWAKLGRPGKTYNCKDYFCDRNHFEAYELWLSDVQAHCSQENERLWTALDAI